MRYVRLLLEYDGTGYHGWQSQKSGGTIQDIITEKIFCIVGERVRLTGASRTDAGVHALGQTAAFCTSSLLSPETIKRALNAKLPPDIRVIGSFEADKGFHPRYDAIRKSYFYIISTDKVSSPFLYRYAWTLRRGLDLENMRKASSLLLGEHDFSSFRGSGCSAKTTVRTVYSADITSFDGINFMMSDIRGSFIKIRLEANAFLRHMARNIVGTLVEAGKGSLRPEKISDILESCDRKNAGPAAPPNGLFLEKVIY